MKKLFCLILALSLVLALFAGCQAQTAQNETTETTQTSEPEKTEEEPKETEEEPAESEDEKEPEESEETEDEPEETTQPEEDKPTAEPVTVRLGGLKGPTTIGMLGLLKNADEGTTANKYEYTIAAAADELTPMLVKGEIDVIAAPVNLASVLYNNTEGAVQFAAVNTLGVLYIVEKGGESIQSIADLRGMTIYATGKGTTPEYSLRYLLSQNDLDPDADVTIEWKSEPTEVVGVLNEAETGVAMLPQPFVTVAQTQVEGLRVALSLTDEWNKLDNGSQLITAGLIVRRAFIEENPEAFTTFLSEYAASTQYVNENVEEAAELCESYGIVKAGVAKKAIPFCNITYIDGEDMVNAVTGYLTVLFEQNPKAVGGAMPGEDFFYLP